MPRAWIAVVVALSSCNAASDASPPEGGRGAALGKTLQRCPGSPYATIQSAIKAAATGDVIEVCAGTYKERLTLSGKTLTLRSVDGAAATILDGTLGGRTVRVESGSNVTIEGFTIRNGVSATGTGGDVYCKDSTLVLRDNVLTTGLAVRGGGYGTSSCGGVVQGNTFFDNVATDRGGGLYAGAGVDVLDNAFEANHSEFYGGGAYVKGSYADLAGNTVVGNTSVDDGAGIYVEFGAPFVDGNTFDANDSSDEGGGLRIKLAEATITDNVFTDNHADYRGGAMKVSHDEVTMTGNTYTGNTAWVTAGAVLMYESASDVTFEHYEGNEADNGGAMAIIAGWGGIDIQDSTFVDNEADLGGHLYVDLDKYTTTLRRVELIDGDADLGGAVYALGTSVVKFEATLFDGNVASVSGGAAYFDGVGGTVVNVVARGNVAPEGSALTVVNGVTLTVTNTIFAENTGGAAIRLSSGLAPTFRYDDFYANAGDVSGLASPVGANGNLAVSPGFVDAAAGDYHLTATSAVKDKGDPAISDTNGSRSDMGIYGGPQGY